MMHWFYISSFVVIICLQHASSASVTEDPAYAIDKKELEEFMPLVERLDDHLGSRPEGVIMTYGIKSTSDNKYVRAFTSVKLANGEIALGSVLTNPDVIDALDNKRTFQGIVDIYGKKYQAIYKPVISKSGTVTNYLFAGVPV